MDKCLCGHNATEFEVSDYYPSSISYDRIMCPCCAFRSDIIISMGDFKDQEEFQECFQEE